ncbi:hypothetical protein O6H91_01G083000 [Diphasiastrum complanatum]|uniref:Uncharacterized protein n=4 Tax=Diphasiastrum complanatum TaxID=34168 RepID=A0ACC2ESR0_DIPCM|nr:hypothetical protein O6H91_01G083000 [Diphasiastrum complanatum]KAJ7569543.1 hypothetical protein O6H91_01G083000 [Diphasiastrum complanatum]KAJ7569544.1 hypothetical protein O6H91_01G083000 [Diphasiastrum complanatum]KAJ7569545.1 hypothetical protein O6H91_01G083000 [Diphasiastrum complanatum]
MGKRKAKENDHLQHNEFPSCSSSSEHLVSSKRLDDASDSSNDGSSQFSQDVVNVDFEFFDPKESDFHGLQALLRSYLDDVAWDLTTFVELILAQTTVGTVIKTAEDESPIGFITALNLERYKAHSCMQEIRTFLMEKCGSTSEAGKLEALWQKQQGVGLIVNERLVNVPVDLAPPLYEGLFQEIAWATEDEPIQSLRDAFKFTDYLILTRVYQEIPKKKGSAKSKNKKTKKKPRNLPQEVANLIYIKPEDEIFHKLSSWSCTFPVDAETLAGHETRGLKLLRLVMCIEADRVQDFAAQLSSLVQ